MKKQIPKFRTLEQERKFWDTHSVTDYLDDLKPAKIKSVRPKKRLISLRLETPQIEALKTIASQKGLGDLSLVRLWVAEKLSQESHQYSIHQG